MRADIYTVLDFVDRTVARGVPVRVAISRAEKKYGVQRSLVRAFYRSHKA